MTSLEVVLAIVAPVSALGGVWLGRWLDRRAQQERFAEERAREDRAQLRRAVFSLLATSDRANRAAARYHNLPPDRLSREEHFTAADEVIAANMEGDLFVAEINILEGSGELWMAADDLFAMGLHALSPEDDPPSLFGDFGAMKSLSQAATTDAAWEAFDRLWAQVRERLVDTATAKVSRTEVPAKRPRKSLWDRVRAVLRT